MERSPLLIGLVGRSGHGKDTIGDYIRETYQNIETYAFAAPLKQAIQEIFHLSKPQLHDSHLKETVDEFWRVTPRQLMQFIGTDLFRNHMGELIPDLGKTIWLQSFLKWRKNQKLPDGKYPGIVVTDVRFKNEAELIKSLGGVIWRVDRSENISNMSDASSSHVSETEMSSIDLEDWIIKNDGTLADLYKKVEAAMSIFFLV